MQKVKLDYKALILIYICLLLLLGSYLLLSSNFLMNHNTPSKLPLDFLLRFGIFWFISFVLALLFFVIHIRMHQYTLTSTEIIQSNRVGTYTFICGVGMAVISGLLFYTLT